jgi:hypothetical protein
VLLTRHIAGTFSPKKSRSRPPISRPSLHPSQPGFCIYTKCEIKANEDNGQAYLQDLKIFESRIGQPGYPIQWQDVRCTRWNEASLQTPKRNVPNHILGNGILSEINSHMIRYCTQIVIRANWKCIPAACTRSRSASPCHAQFMFMNPFRFCSHKQIVIPSILHRCPKSA